MELSCLSQDQTKACLTLIVTPAGALNSDTLKQDGLLLLLLLDCGKEKILLRWW